MLAARVGGEKRIEAHHACDLAVRLVKRQGDVLEDVLRQVAEDPLRDLQHGDREPPAFPGTPQDLVEPLHELRLGRLPAARAGGFISVHAALPSFVYYSATWRATRPSSILSLMRRATTIPPRPTAGRPALMSAVLTRHSLSATRRHARSSTSGFVHATDASVADRSPSGLLSTLESGREACTAQARRGSTGRVKSSLPPAQP